MSIGKLQAALAAATNEVTVAAANINFDFTLVKYEAPREYQHIGGLLSTKRKRDAESGTAHITARRLGSLFEDVCPPTPNLIKAYGKRASEIAELAGSKDTGDYSKSIFGSYSGVDATSIWAAATSSKAALPVHLLSCMLARVFEAPEAISIWVELVKEQRHNISKRLEDGESLPFSLAAAAAQQEISRTQLAEWDSSARSWLRTADSIKERKQTQLRLVLENINLPVNDKTVVFASVVDAWKAALTTMENLVSGAPQAVTDGAAIVGLSAWHLYPDMTVFGPKITEISMKDELIQTGGVLSLGLSSSTKETSPGVYWCLSLTFMRYYGQPVRSERQLLVNPKRITFPQFQIAVLGTVLGTWKIPLEHTRICIEILFALGSQFKKLSNMRLQDRWVEVITQPASTYLDAKGEEKEIASRLIHLDRRRASDFIPPSSTCPDLSVFNLLDTQVLFRCLKDNEGRISLLRRIAARYPNLSEESTLLRCRYDDDGNSDPDSTLHETTSDTEHEGLVEPRSEVDSEADSDEVLEDYSEPGSPASEPASQSKMEIDESELQKPAEEITMATKTVITTYATAYPRIPSFVQGSAFSNIIANDEHHHRGLPVTNSREMFVPEEESAHEYSPGTFWGNDLMAVNYHHERLEFFFGSTTSVAMFVKQRDRNWMELPAITYDDISWCLQHELFSMEKLERLITNWHSPIYETLSLLSVATTIYATLRDATVNVECLNSPLPKTNIGKHVISESFSRHKDAKYRFPRTVLTRSSAMGLVAYFEGANDIDISQLEEVMAISAGDSIYVPKRLVCDPMNPAQDYELIRILGNIGKPGIVMLISPADSLMVRDIDSSSWQVSSFLEFDGIPEDCFTGTSLHLSFTDYHIPIFQTNSRGQKDSQISIWEAVISIRDSGVWVADVDILRALSDGPIYRIQPQKECNHPKDSVPSKPLLSVGCWNDVLDHQDGRLVVKAHGNWIARLAATVLLAQNSKRPATRISICPPHVCWMCLPQDHEHNVFIY